MNILEKTRNFAKSAFIFVKAGMPCVDEAKVYERLEICSKCENFNPDSYGGAGECKICGCNMEIKTVMATESCPKGKW